MVYQNNHGVTIEGIEVFGEVKGMHHNHWPSTIVRDFVEKRLLVNWVPFLSGNEKLEISGAWIYPADSSPDETKLGPACIDGDVLTPCQIEYDNPSSITTKKFPFLVVQLKDPSHVLAVTIYPTPNPTQAYSLKVSVATYIFFT